MFAEGSGKPPMLTRRLFLSSAAPLVACGLSSLLSARFIAVNGNNDQSRREEVVADLLKLVNEERSVAGVSPLDLDDLACRVATAHATDMASGSFVSHWGRDGRKAYHRYSIAGGIHATHENVASVDNLHSLAWNDVMQELLFLHLRMYQETPPNDGHRKTILAPQHTHVGFGFALDESRLRLVEMFVAKYVEVRSFQPRAKRKATVRLSGRLLNPSHILNGIDVFYEPLPKPPDATFLRTSRSYSLPDEFRSVWPKLRPGVEYSDGTRGDIKLDIDGRFSAPLKLFKDRPGIYIVVLWIKKSKEDKAFPATEICIEVD